MSNLERLDSAQAASAVEGTMFRALAVLRVALLLNALALGWYRRDNVDHPWAAAVVFGLMVAWTIIALSAYSSKRWRRAPLLIADLALTLAAILVSPLIKGPDMRATLPGFWVAGVVFAWALHWRTRGGLIAAVIVSAADLLVRFGEITQTNYANIFLLVIGGPIVGFLSAMMVTTAQDRARAERLAAAEAERARLARAVHDGVLQVLALVQRKGAEAGGEFAELGRLAGEQESALRALVQLKPHHVDVGPDRVDLVSALAQLSGRSAPVVQFSASVDHVEISLDRAQSVVAIVAACLDNVAAHVGPDQSAWVFLEEEGTDLLVTVRDDGAGIPPGRLEAARAEGRLGVRDSILGRLRELGGTYELNAAEGMGTEWEFRIPKEADA